MRYARSAIVRLALPAVAALLLCVVRPLPLQAEDKDPAPVAAAVEATSPTVALSRRWRTDRDEQGFQGRYYSIRRPAVGGQFT